MVWPIPSCSVPNVERTIHHNQWMRTCHRHRSHRGGGSGSAEYLLGGDGGAPPAVEALPITPGHILVHGKRRIAGCRIPQTAAVDGDARSASIAAASIMAKVSRDSIMEEYAQLYPGYGSTGIKATAHWIISLRLHAWAIAASSLVICASMASGRATTGACIVGPRRQEANRPGISKGTQGPIAGAQWDYQTERASFIGNGCSLDSERYLADKLS